MIIHEVSNLIKEVENYNNPGFGPPPPMVPPPFPMQRPPQSSGLLKKTLIGAGVGLAGLGALGYAANTGVINYPGIPKLSTPIPKVLPPSTTWV